MFYRYRALAKRQLEGNKYPRVSTYAQSYALVDRRIHEAVEENAKPLTGRLPDDLGSIPNTPTTCHT